MTSESVNSSASLDNGKSIVSPNQNISIILTNSERRKKMKNVWLILVTVIVCVSGLVKADITSGLVAHWKFDEGTGSVAADSAGGHTATLHGDATWETGVDGGALLLDGKSDWAQAEGYKGITGTTSRTCAAWVKFTRPDYTAKENIMCWGNSFGNGTRWIMVIEGDTMPGTEGAFRAGVGDGRVTGSTDIRDNKWHHVTAVYGYDGSPSSLDITIYVDGVEESLSHSKHRSLNTGSLEDVVIGSTWWKGNLTSRTQGLIDDVRIYDRALSDVEVWQLFNAFRELESLEVVGPAEMAENSQSQYNAIAHYDDGSSMDVTAAANWFVEPDEYADIDSLGLLTTGQLFNFQEQIVVFAEYSEDDVQVDAEIDVMITTDSTVLELVQRNISSTMDIKQKILEQLETALERETTAQSMLWQMMRDRDFGGLKRIDIIEARMNTVKAIIDEIQSKRKIYHSIDKLETSMDILEGNTNPGQSAPGQQKEKNQGNGKLE